MRKAKKQTAKKPTKSTAIVKHIGTQVQERSPSDLIAMAIDKDLDVDKLQRLIEMRNEAMREQARRTYYEALAKFQNTVPEIAKTKLVSFGDTRYSYAPLESVIKQIKEPLQECGLVYQFSQEFIADGLKLTCTLTHKDGHSESFPMIAPPDDSGKKNKIQARGSTVTYLQRYTLLGALGIATADADTDGIVPQAQVKKQSATKEPEKKPATPEELFNRAMTAIGKSKTPDEVFAIMSGIGKVKSFSEDQIAKLKSAANAKVDAINAEGAK